MIHVRTLLMLVLISKPCCAMQAGNNDVESIILRFRQRITALEHDDKVTAESISEAARSALDGVRIEDLAPSQLARLEMTNLLRHVCDRRECAKRLEAQIDDPGSEGAAAAVLVAYWMLYVSPDEETNVRLLRQALTHPGLGEAIRQGAVPRLFSMAWVPGPELRARVVTEIVALEQFLDLSMHPWVAADLLALEELYTQIAVEGRPEVRRRTVPKMVKAAQSAQQQLSAPEWAAKGHAEDREQAQHVISQLRGAAVQRRLIGFPAPRLAIRWSSDKEITALDDLEGKVVVLDFWATWCGACIRDFPKLRALQEEFEDDPVVILGLTRLYGRYLEETGKLRYQAEEDRELLAMRDFIKEREMTWPVVFADKQFFAEFGVRGIPHIAIIGPDGRVVANGVETDELGTAIRGLLQQLGHRKSGG